MSLLLPVIAGLLHSTAALAVDKSGVSPNTISLPSGPGSIEGLGESFEPTLNTGTAKYGLGVSLPPGTAGHAPVIRLGYEGGRGNGPLGFGWRIRVPSVQRQSDKGIPRYVDAANGIDDDRDGSTDEADERDGFISSSGEELVPTAPDGYFFSENEGAFVRYRRVGDHWEAHLPDGTLLEFGLNPEARIEDGGRIFRWLVERSIDTHGNTVVYHYRGVQGMESADENTNQRYLEKIEYGPGAPREDGVPWDNFHFVAFEYEPRDDWFEDARSGFLVRTGLRLKEIVVGTQGPLLAGHLAGDFNHDSVPDALNRKYVLDYDPLSHGSLLTSVTQLGADGVSALPPMTLGYTKVNLPDSISASGATLGSPNAPLRVMDDPAVDLIDLNGDALPDILRTQPAGGNHLVSLNEGESGGEIGWASEAEVGGDARAANFDLESSSSPVAHLADMDGDGRSDFVYRAVADVYYFPNGADLSWGTRVLMNVHPAESAPPSPFGADDVKTADIDFDKRMDIVQSISVGNGADYRIWFNLENGRYAKRTTVSPGTGFMLSEAGVQIADVNGDRVPDIVRIRPGKLQVTAGLGHGQFAPLREIGLTDYNFDSNELARVRLQDITGDGLVDLVLEGVPGNKLYYWVNHGNYSLDERRIITGMPTQFGLNPELRWADMNGNGTVDLVYSDRLAVPRIQTIDIGRLLGCEPSPNLLKTIRNGIGRIIAIDYTTSTEYLLADESAVPPRDWLPLPFPLDVVSRTTLEDSLGHVYVSEFSYHEAYYDSEEKEFRGFKAAEKKAVGDLTAPDLIQAYTFDTGDVEEALKGKTLSVEARNAADEVFYREEKAWSTQVLHAGADGDTRRVTFAFKESDTRDVLERGNGSPVQLSWEFAYDDYGNPTLLRENGRADAGWGDERETVRVYTASHASGRASWILRGVCEETVLDPGTGARVANERTYYDGSLVLCEVSRGDATRTENWVSGSDYVVSTQDYDTYGNLEFLYDPLYGTQPGHFRQLVYDAGFHSYPEQEIFHTGNPALPTLSFSATYDPGFGLVHSSTDVNGFTTHYSYDSLARLTSATRPPDLVPTVEYDYVMAHDLGGGALINWVETRQRDGSPGDGFLHARTFSDGLGRTLMTRSEGEGGAVIVAGVVQFNARQTPWRQYLPYAEAVGSLDYAAPSYASDYTEHYYDALGRQTRVVQPDGSFATTEYGPLFGIMRDHEQGNPASPHYGSARRFVRDGLLDEDGSGRLREVTEIVKISDLGEPLGAVAEWLTRYDYDLRDNLTKITDSQGNQKTFGYDGLNRKIFLDDPDRGAMTYEYDVASNPTSTVDARGQAIVYGYDGLNRPVTENYLDQTGDPLTDPVDVTYVYDRSLGPVDLGDGSVDTPANTLGFLVSVFDLSGEEHTSYDARGRVAWEVKRVADPASGVLAAYKTEMTSDSMDRMESMIFPDNDRIFYEYNARGLLERIVGGASGSLIADIDYQASGQTDSLEYGNGVVTDYAYDSRLRVVGLRTAPVTDPSHPLIDYAYTFDAASNIQRIDDLRPAADIAGGEARRNTRIFEYDDLYRLTRVQHSFAVPGQMDRDDGSIAYRYDRIGNMRSKLSAIEHLENGLSITDLGSLSHGGNAGSSNRIGRGPGDPPGPHAVTSAQQGAVQRSYAYDDNGNMTELDGKALAWDFKDRLVSVTDGHRVAQYTYDYADRRILKAVIADTSAPEPRREVSVYPSRSFEVRAPGEPVKYVFNGDTRVARVTGTLEPGRLRVQRLQLVTGWNLLTLAVQAGDAAAQLGLGSEPNISAAFRWNPGSGQYDALTTGSEMPAGSVVWLRASSPLSLQVKGSYSEPAAAPVAAGGRFVAVPGLQALDRVLPPEAGQAWVFDAQNQVWRGHFGGDLDFLSSAPAAVAPGDVIYLQASGASRLTLPDTALEIRYYHQDHLGSSNVVADGDGNLVEEVAFYPFGEPRNEHRPEASTGEPYLFTQKEKDKESGLQYFEARYLAASSGRFLSVDPALMSLDSETLMSPQELHAYSYPSNNPLNLTDPTGMSGESIGELIDEQGYAGAKQGGWTGATKVVVAAGVKAVWTFFGAEGLSRTLEKGDRATTEDKAWAAVEVGTAVIPGAAGAIKGISRLLGGVARTSKAATVLGPVHALPGPTMSGHGTHRVADGLTTVPKGTSFTQWTKHGKKIYHDLGQAIELGQAKSFAKHGYGGQLEGAVTHLPGAKIPNYTLGKIESWAVKGTPVRVWEPTQLKDLLRPYQGNVNWAACCEIIK